MQFEWVFGISVYVLTMGDHAGKSSSEAASGDTFLQACRFFDRECIGYLDADDLEEIAFMISDGISRKRTAHKLHAVKQVSVSCYTSEQRFTATVLNMH